MLYLADFPCVFSCTVVRAFSSFVQTPYSNFPPPPFIFFLLITAASLFRRSWHCPQGNARGTCCPSGQTSSLNSYRKGRPSVWPLVVQRLILKTVWRARTIPNVSCWKRCMSSVGNQTGIGKEGDLRDLRRSEKAGNLVQTGKILEFFWVFLTPCSRAPCHRMVQIPEVYWVQNVSVRLTAALSSVNWCSSLDAMIPPQSLHTVSIISVPVLVPRPWLGSLQGQDTGLLSPFA